MLTTLVFGTDYLFAAMDWGDIYEGSDDKLGVLPVVTIKSDSLDISNPTDNSGKWGYAWKIQ